VTDLTTAEYMEYAHHLREAGQTVTADAIDALVAAVAVALGTTAIEDSFAFASALGLPYVANP
jgi:predicted nucleic acid-binding protein